MFQNTCKTTLKILSEKPLLVSETKLYALEKITLTVLTKNYAVFFCQTKTKIPHYILERYKYYKLKHLNTKQPYKPNHRTRFTQETPTPKKNLRKFLLGNGSILNFVTVLIGLLSVYFSDKTTYRLCDAILWVNLVLTINFEMQFFKNWSILILHEQNENLILTKKI